VPDPQSPNSFPAVRVERKKHSVLTGKSEILQKAQKNPQDQKGPADFRISLS